MVDLDGFKQVNDAFGHDAGDDLLRSVAERLTSSVRPGDTAARWGGDEFCILLPDADEVAAVTVANRIIAAVVSPVHHKGKEMACRASVGVATCADGSLSAEELVRNADVALYASKGSGKGRSEIFTPMMHATAVDALELRMDLEHAIVHDQFTVHYQPIIGMENGQAGEVEALVRWNHPERGMILPAEFIPQAEKMRLIVPLGELVLRKACKDAAEWRRSNPRASQLGLSVNISARQLLHPAFEASVVEILAESGLPASALTLEVTERVLVETASDAPSVLASLRTRGIKIAIDDFGTGYASLQYLRELPVDVVKIDRSFVQRLATSDDRAFSLSIIHMIETMGMETVAEGVETQDQAEYVQAMGCDRAQGYHFARPLDAIATGALLASGVTFPVGQSQRHGPGARSQSDLLGTLRGLRVARRQPALDRRVPFLTISG
jgi:diguanylate cyclase (GGDEF)-like protein